MNKQEFIEAVADRTDTSRAEVGRMLRAILDQMSDSLTKGEEVQFIGDFTMSVGDRAARTGRNPRTGEKIQIPAAKVVKFRAGQKLKDAINNREKEISSAGRASPLQGECRGFDPLSTHQYLWSGSSAG